MSVHTMETLALFDSAPYQNAFSARVIAVSEHGVALEHTLFYPTGGGQPGDTGHLTLADGTRVEVTGTVRDPVQRSIIWHQVEHCPEQLTAGVQVDVVTAPAPLHCDAEQWMRCEDGDSPHGQAGSETGTRTRWARSTRRLE